MRLDRAVEGAFRHDRVSLVLSRVGLTGLARGYLFWDAARMAEMSDVGMGAMAMQAAPILDWPLALMTFVMWSVMMVGMMTPSVAPTILLYARMVRKNRERGEVLPAASIFTAGYLIAWTGFSALATALQLGLGQVALLSPMMVSTSAWLTGTLLIAAGLYQWLPIKDICLKFCRSPMHFILGRWRSGPFGALAMGLENGLYCVGCCWALMLLLFAGGVMNLGLVALIAGFVIAEKLLPLGQLTARAAGAVLIGLGVWSLWGGLAPS
jgi:predicted metal-binding membrane protein